MLAGVAATVHIALDFDRLTFTFEDFNQPAQGRIAKKIKSLVKKSFTMAVILPVIYPLVYLVIRRTIWNFVFPLASKIYTIHSADVYSGFPVSLGMLFNTFLACFMLIYIWLFAHASFSVYLTLGPSHRGELISAKSSDKNGTLVNGLQQTTKPLIRMLAFQELAYIAFNKQERRISIFADIERKPPIWESIRQECLKLLTDITTQLVKKPETFSAKPVTTGSRPAIANVGVIPIKTANVFAYKPRPHLVDGLQDPNATASAEALAAVSKIQTKFESTSKKYSRFFENLLDSDLGYPFRFTVERRARKLIPNPMQVSTGILALATLICKSLSEDQYGTVQKDVPLVLSCLCDVSQALQNFINHPPVHWSNNKEKEVPEFKLEHVRNVLDAVEESFEMIVVAFFDFLPNLHVSNEVKAKITRLQQE